MIGVDIIQVLCDEMTESQQLSVTKEKLDQFPDDYLTQMASEGVLSFDGKRYGFGHENFFDYCFARAFMTKGRFLGVIPRFYRNNIYFAEHRCGKSSFIFVMLTGDGIVKNSEDY